MDQPYVMGIDIGGTNTIFGIVDKRGQILRSGAIKTTRHADVGDYLDELAQALNDLLKNNFSKDDIRGIGVGAPNGNYFSGSIEFAPNLPWKGVIPFAQMLEERIGCTHLFQ
jgi:glucokinase